MREGGEDNKESEVVQGICESCAKGVHTQCMCARGNPLRCCCGYLVIVYKRSGESGAVKRDARVVSIQKRRLVAMQGVLTPGYRANEIHVKCRTRDISVTVPEYGPVEDTCVICGDELPSPHSVLLQHRVDGIQVYSVCGKCTCYEALGKRMAKGKR